MRTTSPKRETVPVDAIEDDDLYVTLRRPLSQFIWGFVCLFLLVWVITGAVTNPNLDWSVVGKFLFDDRIIAGLMLTLRLTVVAMVVGIVLGVVLAIMRISSNPVLQAISWGYSWVFRAVPTLVQLIFWFNLGALYEKLSVGIPFGPTFISVDTNVAITAWSAAILGLGLHEAAYMAEITRSGLEAVDRGQREAAVALGMSRKLVMRRVILPQAIRIIIPPTGNQVIGMLKMTSLVSVIALSDLLYSAQYISARNFQIIPLLVVIVLWYLLVTSILMVGQHYLERHMSRSDRIHYEAVEVQIADEKH